MEVVGVDGGGGDGRLDGGWMGRAWAGRMGLVERGWMEGLGAGDGG